MPRCLGTIHKLTFRILQEWARAETLSRLSNDVAGHRAGSVGISAQCCSLRAEDRRSIQVEILILSHRPFSMSSARHGDISHLTGRRILKRRYNSSAAWGAEA